MRLIDLIDDLEASTYLKVVDCNHKCCVNCIADDAIFMIKSNYLNATIGQIYHKKWGLEITVLKEDIFSED